MQNFLEEISLEEQVKLRIAGMRDSLWLIDKLISDDVHNEYTHDTMNRNICHLEIMLAKPEIQNSENDLSSFETAITNGKAFMAVQL